MRVNTDKSYKEIYTKLPSELQPYFLEKVFRDNSNNIVYFHKKYLKYKTLMYFFGTVIVLLLASMIIYKIQLV
jgi:hypothetical protein